VWRRKIVNKVVLCDINIILITPGDYGARFDINWKSLGARVNSPNGYEICRFE
jgi:hypothetical protein